MTTRFVLATANPDKASEIEAVLREAGVPIELEARDPSLPEIDETGETLEENARLKAIEVATWTGQPAIADDTGLEVDALDGAPGVRSARFAGDGATYADNVALLLDRLASDGPHGSAPLPSHAGPTGVRSQQSARSKATSPARRAARRGSGTTRSSFPTTVTAGRSPRCRPLRSTRARIAGARSEPLPTGSACSPSSGIADGRHRHRRVRR
jgi:hypothetical protein